MKCCFGAESQGTRILLLFLQCEIRYMFLHISLRGQVKLLVEADQRKETPGKLTYQKPLACLIHISSPELIEGLSDLSLVLTLSPREWIDYRLVC